MAARVSGSLTTVLLLAPLKPGCGNCTTARRLKALIAARFDRLLEQDPNQFSCQRELQEYLATQHVGIILALHALHCGRLLEACPTPFILLFGGTDLNEYPQHPDALAIMTASVRQAQHLVGFSPQMVKKARSIWPDIEEDRISVIPQAVIVHKSITTFIFWHHLRENCRGKEINEDSYIFSLVASLRPVKCPTFLLQAFSDWHKKRRPDVFLAILGPVMENPYSASVLKEINRLPGVVYGGCLPGVDAHAAIKQSFAVVNSSQSEGMSSAILESMAIGCPVIARNIPGNAAVVNHRKSGLLYNTPQEFIVCSEKLLNDPGMRRHLVAEAHLYIKANHTAEMERSSYCNLISRIIQESKSPTSVAAGNS